MECYDEARLECLFHSVELGATMDGHKSQSVAILAALFFCCACFCARPVVADDWETNPGKAVFEHEWDRPTPQMIREHSDQFAKEGRGVALPYPAIRKNILGPLYNAKSCAACHPGGGATGVKGNVMLITIDPRSDVVVNANEREGHEIVELFPQLVGKRGTLSFQTIVHNHSKIKYIQDAREKLRDHVPDGVPDAWFDPEKRTVAAIAERPVVAGRYKNVDFYLSQRNTPALFGVGWIEQISFEKLKHIASTQAIRSEGRISGRVAGKYGWRGQVSMISQFVSQACANELGIISSNALARQRGIATLGDISPAALSDMVSYVYSLPSPTEGSTTETYHGEKVFNRVGCADCHVPDVRPAMGIFSDLLLHDMGPDLQSPMFAPTGASSFSSSSSQTLGLLPPMQSDIDFQTMERPNYAARGSAPEGLPTYYGDNDQSPSPAPLYMVRQNAVPAFPPAYDNENAEKEDISRSIGAGWETYQREWRTPPLWGVSSTAPYLHDGRAATLREAILMHGGEAKSSRDKFDALDESEKAKLIAFLESLRAPETEE